jgi:hypothetical protein
VARVARLALPNNSLPLSLGHLGRPGRTLGRAYPGSEGKRTLASTLLALCASTSGLLRQASRQLESVRLPTNYRS